MSNSNLEIWKKNARPNRTMINHSDNGLASVQAYYMFEQATKQFGPIGIGWGYNIVETKMLDGAPIHPLNPGEPQLLEKACLVQVKLWYTSDGSHIEMPPLSGTAKYIYLDFNLGCAVTNFDAERVALTNAIKKSLSMLGFAADVYMGKHNEELAAKQPEQGIPSPSTSAANDETEREKMIAHDEILAFVKSQIEATESMSSPAIRQGNYGSIKKQVIARCQEARIPNHKFIQLIDEKAA